jgi:hypothetical protein
MSGLRNESGASPVGIRNFKHEIVKFGRRRLIP